MAKGGWWVVLPLIALPLTGCYAVRQAYHQNNLFNARVPIQELLADATLDSKTRSQLEFANEVLKFAHNAGLNAEGAYTYYIDLPGHAVSHLVQAAYVDRLEFVTWWFPIVGRVPYLGFFDVGERDRQAEALFAQGYDVYKGQVGAFSSLGWFEDPIYSSMLRRREGRLAHLLFHELTHRTVWIKGSTQFNENLAEFVAFQMTTEFLMTSGRESELEIYRAQAADTELFKKWLSAFRQELESFYTDNRGVARNKVLEGRQIIFSRYLNELLPQFSTAGYQAIGKRDWNNASLLSASLYSPDFAPFERAYRCHGQTPMGKFLEALSQLVRRQGSAEQSLDELCRQRG